MFRFANLFSGYITNSIIISRDVLIVVLEQIIIILCDNPSHRFSISRQINSWESHCSYVVIFLCIISVKCITTLKLSKSWYSYTFVEFFLFKLLLYLIFRNWRFLIKMCYMSLTSDKRFHPAACSVGWEMINLLEFALPQASASRCLILIHETVQKSSVKAFQSRYSGTKALFIRTLHLNRDKKPIPIIRLLVAANNLNSLKMP